MTERDPATDMERFAQSAQRFAKALAESITEQFKPFNAAVARMQESTRRNTMSFMQPDHLQFPPLGGRYTPEQVIQRAIEAYMNGGLARQPPGTPC